LQGTDYKIAKSVVGCTWCGREMWCCN